MKGTQVKKLQSFLVLVKVDEVKEQDERGIYIVEEWKELPQTGTVLKVGAKVTFCKEGENVFFSRYAAIRTMKEGEMLCQEQDILAIL